MTKERLRRLPVVLLLVAGSASAQSPRERAQALVRQGNSALDGGACREALERFEQALAIYPEGYRIHVNIGSAHQCLGRLPEAITHFERFLLRAEPRRDEAMIAELRARFDRARAKVAGLRLICTVENAAVLVDAKEVGRTPLLHAIYLEPGVHDLEVRGGQEPFRTRLELAAGSMRELRVPWDTRAPPRPAPAVIERPAPEPAPPRPTPVYRRWWFWTIVGVAVAGATVGGVLGARAAAGDGLPVGEVGPPIDLGRP